MFIFLGVKLRLHGQFFTRDYNAIFGNYCVAIARKKIATLLHGALPIFSDRKIVRILLSTRLDLERSTNNNSIQ